MPYFADLRAVLRSRDFRRLFGTRLTSQFGDGILQGGLAGYVFFSPDRQTTATQAAAAFAALLLPYSLVGPFAGVFIDRWSRRQILTVSAVIRACLVALTVAVLTSGGPVVFFYLGVLAVLGVNRFFLAALSAALPHVVSRAELVMANAITPTSGTVVAFVGAGTGGVLPRIYLGPGRTGVAVTLGLAAVLYLVAGLVATSMPRSLLGPEFDPALPGAREALRRVMAGLVGGIEHVWHRRQAALALGAVTGHRFLYGIATLMTTLLFRNYFHGNRDIGAGITGFGLVVVASGAGYFAAAFATPHATAHMAKQTWVTVMLGTAAVALLAVGVPLREGPFAFAGFVLGLSAQGVKICVDTLVQEHVQDAYRGRVFAAYDMLFNVAFVVAAGFAAVTLPPDGASYPVLGFIVAGYAVCAVGYGTVWRRVDRLGRPTEAVHGGADGSRGTDPGR